jgi:hypothetical protein
MVSCEQSSINSPTTDNQISSHDFDREALISDMNASLEGISSLEDINTKLAASGLNVKLAYAETVTSGADGADAAGQTIFANDREKQLTAQWVPGDARRLADGNNLNYVVFEPLSFANGTVDSEPAIDASFDTWNRVKKKSKLNIIKRADSGVFPSAIFAGGDPFVADIVELGFLPAFVFEGVLGPGAGTSVLGVAFTFVFIDENGDPTDINNDGFSDVALKEIWYNDDFLWTTDPNGTGVDIETVALHENGHALGFGHFGKISVTNYLEDNAKLHVSPRAVMNAIILGTQRDLLGTDQASYNSIYGNWPK